MAEAAGEHTIAVLLSLLPEQVVAAVMGHLPPQIAQRISERLRTLPRPVPDTEVETALAQFFDLLRIAERPVPPPAPEKPSPGDTAAPQRPANASAAPTAAPPHPLIETLQQIQAIPPERLAQILQVESPGTVAMILSALEPAYAGKLLARLPAGWRPEITLRLSKLTRPQPALLQQLLNNILEKARQLGEMPGPRGPEDIVTQIGEMLRSMPRLERMPLVRQLESVDPDLAAKVREQLMRLEDLVKIPDRQLQVLLSKLEMKTLAIALKNAPEAVRDKIAANLSSRARQTLQEEMELSGDVLPTQIKDAQTTILSAVAKAEENGEITIMD